MLLTLETIGAWATAPRCRLSDCTAVSSWRDLGFVLEDLAPLGVPTSLTEQ
jgi:hypothetical protein